tara:strand:- start:30643 stop:31239 length:597 start_codon:yes stop_codon:yes gene_type:complete
MNKEQKINRDDNKLVENIKSDNNVENSLKELISRHSGIYIEMVNYYTGPMSCLDKDELIREKESNIYLCALKYEDDRNTKFSTFLGNQTKWLCLNKINSIVRGQKKEREASMLAHSTSYEALSNDADISLLSHDIALKSVSDPRARRIIKLRYLEGIKNKVMPWRSVSQSLGLSIQGCINIHNRAMKKIQQNIDTLND